MCYGDLDLGPLTLKINRVRPLVISSKCTKFEGPSWNGSDFSLYRVYKLCGQRDRQTDGQTDARAIP